MSRWTYKIYDQLTEQSRAITSEEDVDMVQEMVRLLVRDTKVRKLVQEVQDLVSKVDRCLYTEEFRREDLQTEILRQSLELT